MTPLESVSPIARVFRMRQAAGVDMLTVAAVAVGIPVAGAMMVLAIVTFFGRQARDRRSETRYPTRTGRSADTGSTSGGLGSS